MTISPTPTNSSLLMPQESSDVQPGMTNPSLNAPGSPLGSAGSVGADYDHISRSDLGSSMSASSSRTSGPATTASSEKKARLLYCKSHVAIHPTNFSKDNVSGYLGIVEVDGPDTSNVDGEGNVSGASGSQEGKRLLVTWVPEEVLLRMDDTDREGYKKVESWSNDPKGDKEEDGGRPLSAAANGS